MFGEIMPWHIVVVLIIAVLLWGPKKIPEIARSLGEGIREFKKSFSEGLGVTEHPTLPEEKSTSDAAPKS